LSLTSFQYFLFSFPFQLCGTKIILLSTEIEQKNFANGLGFRVFKALNLSEPRQKEKFEERTRRIKKLKGNSVADIIRNGNRK